MVGGMWLESKTMLDEHKKIYFASSLLDAKLKSIEKTYPSMRPSITKFKKGDVLYFASPIFDSDGGQHQFVIRGDARTHIGVSFDEKLCSLPPNVLSQCQKIDLLDAGTLASDDDAFNYVVSSAKDTSIHQSTLTTNSIAWEYFVEGFLSKTIQSKAIKSPQDIHLFIFYMASEFPFASVGFGDMGLELNSKLKSSICKANSPSSRNMK